MLSATLSPNHRRSVTSLLATGACAFLLLGSGCSGDDDDSGDHGSAGTSAICATDSGPVSGESDNHCVDDDGQDITQEIGKCAADGADLGSGGADSGEEPFEVRYGATAFDDDCKYKVSFENTCVALNEPVTFKVKLERKSDGSAASGDVPDSPEIYLADDPSHISPSNSIHAPEGPDGVYAIGPITFDRSGRWVVRFHFFEECSDLPEDSPHGHVAFYIDVP